MERFLVIMKSYLPHREDERYDITAPNLEAVLKKFVHRADDIKRIVRMRDTVVIDADGAVVNARPQASRRA